MDKFVKDFKTRILRKKFNIGVVGLGYVGLPLALEFARRGIEVIGIEIDAGRLAHLKKKESYITDITGAQLKKVLSTGNFSATADFRVLKNIDVVIICVPTPLKRKYHPNIKYIKQAVRAISKNLKKGSLVILESTTYPGTTDEVILPLLEKGNLKHGRDFYLCFSPERIDPGNKKFPVHRIPKIVGGLSREATILAGAVYKNIIEKVVPVSSARGAEAAKLLENTFRLINIALIDELAMMAHKMKIDIWEVIKAASTKPFGFMPFYPGPGVGGHCLDKSETIFVKEKGSLRAMQMPDVIDYIGNNRKSNVEVLSFDPIKGKSIFRPITAASARPYSGEMFTIRTGDGRELKVTDFHPMFTFNGSSWQLKYAKDLRPGDRLPLCLGLPQFTKQDQLDSKIDLLEEVQDKARHLIDKIRVKPMGFSWRDYAIQIKDILRKNHKGKLPDICWDYLSDNILPLRYLYELQKLVKLDHHKMKLVSGRGPSYSEIPAVIELDEAFWRLIGYYLSEGCYTEDKSARVRFSFNRSEKEYIQDVVNILKRIGVRTSVYQSKKWHSSCIKVSSNLFGLLIDKVLACGRNCYDMSVPERLFSLDKKYKKALISGVFRGDASVEHFFGKQHYRKGEKSYLHNVNTANVSFFTSSKKLSQQVVILLHDLGIVPTFKKRKNTISIFGYKQLSFCKDLFDGGKREIIQKYLTLGKKRARNKTFEKTGEFATVRIRSVLPTRGDWVYSIETTKPHTFVTSYGIVVHNCIPKDPLYLHWKAKHFGFRSRFIKLASDVITYMPEYVVERVEGVLKERGVELSGAKVLVLGVTYKKDVKDLRKSPGLDIIESLKKKGAEVSYFDPLISYLKFNHTDLRSVKLTKEKIKSFDCVIIAADHSSVNYDLVLKNARLIFDSRNIFKGISSERIVVL